MNSTLKSVKSITEMNKIREPVTNLSMPGWKKIANPKFKCFDFIGNKSILHQHKSNDAEDQGFKVIRHDLQVLRGVIRIGKNNHTFRNDL